jgi:hypothetical protein
MENEATQIQKCLENGGSHLFGTIFKSAVTANCILLMQMA